MFRKSFLLAFLLGFVFMISGCTLVRAAQGAAEGAKEDFQVIKKADGWVKDNLW